MAKDTAPTTGTEARVQLAWKTRANALEAIRPNIATEVPGGKSNSPPRCMVKRLQNHVPPHRQGGPFIEPRRTWQARAEWDQVKVARCVN